MTTDDIERVWAQDRKALIRRGSRYVLIDLDEDDKRKHAIEGWIGVFLGCGLFWALVLLAIHQAWRR